MQNNNKIKIKFCDLGGMRKVTKQILPQNDNKPPTIFDRLFLN